jgi:hypothetical protein
MAVPGSGAWTFDSIEKGAACVFHQMPPVSDLDRMRKRPLRSDRVAAAATIPGDDADLRLLRQPGLSPSWLPIRQESDCRMSFEVTDQHAVALVASPSPIIDADNRRRPKASRSTSAHHAQQCVVAHLEVEPTRKRGSRPPAKRDRETVHDIIEPVRPSRS